MESIQSNLAQAAGNNCIEPQAQAADGFTRYSEHTFELKEEQRRGEGALSH
jgi:hypothetical protein